MDNSNSNGKLVSALLLGAAVGGLLGILFAPAKGSETRKKISSKGTDLTDTMKEKFNDFMDGVKKEVDAAKDKTNEFLENGKVAADKLKVN